MTDVEIERNRQIVEVKKRRLYELQLLEAGKGSATDPGIRIEIDKLLLEISEIEVRNIALSASVKQPAEPSIQPLASPLSKYDPFFRRLFERKINWEHDQHAFKQSILSSLGYAMKAEGVFILRHTGSSWECAAAKDVDAIHRANELVLKSAELRKLLDQSNKYYRETKIVNPQIYTNVLFADAHTNSKLCVFVVLPHTVPSQILTFYDINADLDLNSAFATIINTLLSVTKNLSATIRPTFIESTIYNALRRSFGYVSDQVYERQFELFKERLNTMTVYFEPIIELSRSPYIWRWEALARDPASEPKVAPADLFETAKLWGRQFQLELDVYFLRTAVEKFRQIPQGATERSRYQVARRGELAPLHVNVYPDSLIRRAYKEAIDQIEEEMGFPIGKLVLEISEKAPLPQPEIYNPLEDDIKWFREQLMYYTDKGVSFAIDDFGVGYASTSRLSRIEPEFVKIDRDALLHHLGGFTLDYARRLVSESLGKMKMIVEGFDDQSKFTLAQIYELKIRYVQGHLLSRAQEYVFRLSQEDEKRIAGLLKLK